MKSPKTLRPSGAKRAALPPSPLSWRAGDSPVRGNVAVATKGWGFTEAQQLSRAESSL